jgi:hypothetical protein
MFVGSCMSLHVHMRASQLKNRGEENKGIQRTKRVEKHILNTTRKKKQ